MTTKQMGTVLHAIQDNNQKWFDPSNKRFFGDKEYFGYCDTETGDKYLVRSTYAWSDMFGQPPKLHYRINPIGENYEIQPLLDNVFNTLEDVEAFLNT